MTPEEAREKLLKMRFITKIGCWEFTGFLHEGGYGEFRYNGKSWRVHRLMYLIEHGEIPEGMQVQHHCDNPPCFNPGHLYAGTQQENIQDSIDRGRHAVSAGLKTWSSRGSAVPWQCIHGHDLRNPFNVYITPRGYRECRPCRTARAAEFAARKREERDSKRFAPSGF